MTIFELASYRHSIERIRTRWPAFAQKRSSRLAQQERAVSDLSNQVQYADLLLTSNTIKCRR